jgi:hypothetical protein
MYVFLIVDPNCACGRGGPSVNQRLGSESTVLKVEEGFALVSITRTPQGCAYCQVLQRIPLFGSSTRALRVGVKGRRAKAKVRQVPIDGFYCILRRGAESGGSSTG